MLAGEVSEFSRDGAQRFGWWDGEPSRGEQSWFGGDAVAENLAANRAGQYLCESRGDCVADLLLDGCDAA